MKKKKSIGLWVGICLLLMALLGSVNVFAAVTEGNAGEILTGEYAVIINTDTSNSRSAGTLIFDDSGSVAATSSGSELPAVQSLAELNAGSTSSVTALNEKNASSSTASADESDYGISVQAATTTYAVGEEKYIYRSNGSGKTYVCIGIGEHCYIWMDKTMKADYDATGKTSLIAADMASVYDGQPYRILNTLAGGDLPWEDGSGKLSIVLETLSGASGQFQYDVGITAIHINTPAAASYVSGEMTRRNGLLVHEGQHAVLWLKTKFNSSEKYMWINEGLAVTVMDYLWGGTDTNGWMNGIAGSTAIRNGSSLMYKNYRDDTAQDYGMSYLFVRYVIDRMAGSYDPMAVLPKFYTVDASSLTCEAYLEKVTGIPFKTLLSDFYTAVAAGESSGVYSFPGDRIAAKKASAFPVFSGDSGSKYSLPAASAIIVKLKDGKFTVPSDGDSGIVYRVIGSRTSSVKPAGGNGTSSSPYQIDSLDDLNLIEENQGAYYQLTSDIQAQGKINFTSSYFGGTLDGNGHTIYGLKKPLIAMNQGKIRNLRVVADFDDDMQNVQGVITQYNEGNIEDCMVTGTISGYMGGNGAIVYPEFGGIAGENALAGIIFGCTSKLNVNLTMAPMKSWVGGIAGLNIGTISKCVSSGTITVTQTNGDAYPVYVGGIAGEIQKFGSMGGVIKECLHAGKITVTAANNSVGQMCGTVADNVLSSSSGLSGHVLNCYGKSGEGNLVGGTAASIGTGGLLTETQMKDSSSYVGWEFGTDWKISDDGLPERVENPEITSLEVKNNWTSCYVGEKPWDWGKLLINGTTYSNITTDMVSGFDSSAVGTTHVYVEYKGKQIDYSMEVVAPKTSDISSIVISGQPKKSYVEGDVFNPSGASMYATIGGHPAYIYSGFTYDKTAALKTSDTQVTFDYFGAKIPWAITVTANAPATLTMLAAPEKLSYVAGDKLDLTGLKLQITYSNGKVSPVITGDDLDTYGIRLAIRSGSSSATVIDNDRTVEASDNGKYLIAYATDKLPGEYGAVIAVLGTMSVTEPLAITDTELYAVTGTGKEQWIYSGSVTGGSGKYETQVVSENLPTGLTAYSIPSESSYGSKYFTFSGIVTAPVGTYESQYKIVDTGTKAVLPVTIKIIVTASNEARFYSFVLNKTFNSQLKEDVVGEIDNENRKITLRLPKGTDVTKLAPNIDYGSGTGTSLPDEFNSGRSHDFTNPVQYILTAPDGVTKITYTVTVVFYDETQGGSGETEHTHTWDAGVITKAATCVEEGIKTYTCTECGETRLESIAIDPDAHNVVIDAAVAATCKDAGKTEGSHCSLCNKVLLAQTVVPATGAHTWDAGQVTLEVTCTEPGAKKYTCTTCGEEKVETISAPGHKWDDGVITKEATTSSTGVKTFTCTVCGETKTETIPVLTPTNTPIPTVKPTNTPTPTAAPTSTPLPTVKPTNTPVPTEKPEVKPTNTPVPTVKPTNTPVPTVKPTNTPVPTVKPTNTPVPVKPTNTPVPTVKPTNTPAPTVKPTNTPVPTVKPTNTPAPTVKPTNTPVPTVKPTNTPVPTVKPTNTPIPTVKPTNTPALEPTVKPTNTPAPVPTAKPTNTPAPVPTVKPTNTPIPTVKPTNTPTPVPTVKPTNTPVPTEKPTNTPVPTPKPTNTPVPTVEPTITPMLPVVPTNIPEPTVKPTNTPIPTATPMPPTSTPIPTATPVPPTSTPVPTTTPVPPTSTPAPTATPVPPTSTPAPTATPVPPTSTPVPTATPVPPTSTPVPTATPVPPTSTPVPTSILIPTSTPVPPAAPATGYKVGTTVKHPATNGYYKVTGADTVEYIKPVKKKVNAVTIPDNVSLKGANYKVTAIASKAFKSNKYVKKVTIGNNVIQIKSYAFYKCTKLSYVQIGGSVKAIGKQSFYGCKKLKDMRIYTSRLKAKYVGSNAFKGTPSKMRVYVPRKKAKSYKSIFVKRGMSKKIVIKKM